MENADIQKYCGLMEEIKNRIAVIDGILDGSANVKFDATNIETIYLQFRKILELIALGSLVANREEFSRVYEDFAKCWNAELILKDISRINPAFYPEPESKRRPPGPE